MRNKNEGGFIHIIIYILIFILFCVTFLTCLDILRLVDIPKEYTFTEWFDKLFKNDEIEEIEGIEGDTAEQIYKKVKVKIEDNEQTSNAVVQNISNIEGYKASEIISNDEKSDISSDFSYYNQLDEYGKIIYKEIEKNLDNMKSGTYNVQFGTTFNDLLHKENGEEMLNDSFQLAINAINFDNPNLFYLNISKLYLLTRITTKLWITTYDVEIGASQGQSYLNPSFSSKAEVDNAIEGVNYEKARIKSMLSGNDENKVRIVHNYLVENLDYDSSISEENIYNTYGALINRKTVCEGYARAFKSVMDDLEIPCLIACGTGVNSSNETENHDWNYVKLYGRWYAVDVTWDDPIIIGNGRIDPSVNYKYYLKGSNDFFSNHTEKGDIVGDSNFLYPTLSYNNF